MSTPFLDFFRNAPSGTRINIGTSESRGGITSIAGDLDRISERTASSQSFINSANIFGNILRNNTTPLDSRTSSLLNNQFQLSDNLNNFAEQVKSGFDSIAANVSTRNVRDTLNQQPQPSQTASNPLPTQSSSFGSTISEGFSELGKSLGPIGIAAVIGVGALVLLRK